MPEEAISGGALPCARGMLLVFDEIFSGLWRLGTPSAWQRLRVQPDIACYAKLLTGAIPRFPSLPLPLSSTAGITSSQYWQTP